MRSAPTRHLLSLIALPAIALTALLAAQSSNAIRGDVNNDGQVTTVDALAVMSHVVGKPLPQGYTITPNGDANGDGQITAADALVILSFVVGKDVSQFPVGKGIITVSITPATASLAGGDTTRLTATVSGSQNTAVTWRSSATAVATVSETGLVTGVAPGEVVITAISQADTLAKATSRITITQAAADLVVTAITSPANFRAGNPASISYSYQNIGTAIAGSESVNRIYLSTDSTIDATDLLIGTAPGEALGPQATASGKLTFTTPLSLTGTSYFVGMILDATNLIQEKNEANNVRASAAASPVIRPEIAFVRGSAIYLAFVDGGESVRVRDGIDPAWSPDRSRIAFAGIHEGNHKIFIMKPDGTEVRRLTGGVGSDRNPSWSPDGSKIVFARSTGTGSGSGLHVVNADGTGLTQLTPNPNHQDPSWSPDGTRIAYIRGIGSSSGPIYTIRPDGTGERQLTSSGFWFEPAWSPDGSRLLVGHRRELTSPAELVITDANAQVLIILTDRVVGETAATWSPDGSKIAFARYNPNSEVTSRISVIDALGGTATLLTEGPIDVHPSWGR